MCVGVYMCIYVCRIVLQYCKYSLITGLPFMKPKHFGYLLDLSICMDLGLVMRLFMAFGLGMRLGMCLCMGLVLIHINMKKLLLARGN